MDYMEAWSKRTNKDGDFGDVVAFFDSLNTTPTVSILAWLHANVDVEFEFDYQLGVILSASSDHLEKNHFLYHDPGSELWRHLIWDPDLTCGRFFDGTDGGGSATESIPSSSTSTTATFSTC